MKIWEVQEVNFKSLTVYFCKKSEMVNKGGIQKLEKIVNINYR